MFIGELSDNIYRIKLPKEEKEEKKEPVEEANNEDEKGEGENQEETKEHPEELPLDLQEEIDEEDDDSQLTDPDEIKKRFLFRNICLQLYNSDLQISKKLHKFFDPETKGYCSMKQCLFTLYNYYKIIMLPSDLQTVLSDYIIKEQKLETPEDLLDTSFTENKVNKVDFHEFLQQVTRPYVYQVAKKELWINYQDLMKLILNSINNLLIFCQESLIDLYLNEVKEADINNYDAFSRFIGTILGDEHRVPNPDCCEIFVNTFSANRKIIVDGKLREEDVPEEYHPLKIKPVVEVSQGEGEEGEGDEEEEIDKEPLEKKNLVNLMSNATEWNKELSEGNKISRACEFSRQCEIIFLKQFGFRYIMNNKILGKCEFKEAILILF